MLYERIMLAPQWPDAWLDVYVGDRDLACDGILVIPGGGYTDVCSDREGEPIAMAFAARHLSAFVLHYTVAPNGVFPQQLMEAALAMKHIKTNAKRYHVDPERIFVCGFSAGGHLAASLGTLWHLPEVADVMGGNGAYARPKGMILCYPVISGYEFAHRGSFVNLLGTEHPEPELLDAVSLEKWVDKRTVPAFLMHTSDDRVVPVENSLLMAQALSKAKVPYELHIYPHAPHGIALGTFYTSNGSPSMINPAIAQWVEHAHYWICHLK